MIASSRLLLARAAVDISSRHLPRPRRPRVNLLGDGLRDRLDPRLARRM